ncbi:MAG: hypothetical protein FWD83_00775 [Promicromonosporaceae bacterium]|nr:hypothetical protein [Promicromonosporaceae bacterium]
MRRRLLAALTVGLVVAGCSNGYDAASGSDSGGPNIDPDHPWALTFELMYAETESDFIRAILADGVVTPAEVQEATAKTRECFVSIGGPVGVDGTVTWPQDAVGDMETYIALVGDCEDRYGGGVITWLYETMAHNPENDSVEACLIRHGLLPPGSTYEDYWAALTGGCPMPRTLEAGLNSPCWVGVWELAEGEEFPGPCPRECHGYRNLVAQRNQDHQGVYELPGGVRFGHHLPHDATPAEIQAHECLFVTW